MRGMEKEVERLTVEEVLRQWIEAEKGGWKKSTYAVYRSVCENQIFPWIGEWKICGFGEEECTDFLLEMQGKGLSFSSQSQIKNILEQGLQFGARCYGLPSPRFARRKRKKQQAKPLLPDKRTVSALLSYAFANSEDETCLGIILCSHTGLRIGELCALQWKDIDLKDGWIHISKTMQRIRVFQEDKRTEIVIDEPKSVSSNRLIPIPKRIYPYLKENRKEPEAYFIPGKKKAYAEPRTVQYRFQRILGKLDLPYFNFHQLRHIFASNCIMSGFDVKTTSELLGHADIYLTMNRYVHSDAVHMKKLMNTFVLQ